MKKLVILISIMVSTLFLTGCSNKKINDLSQNLKKIELTGNLVTHKAYYHNVIEYDKKKGTGITHLLEKDRKFFAEYTGTIKLGIDLTEVIIDVKGNEVYVTLPKAIVIGEPNVDETTFKAENFIEDKDGINKNPITIEDSTAAFQKAQQNMKEYAASDTELLSMAQKRAKVILEENIHQFSGLADNEYTINWEYTK